MKAWIRTCQSCGNKQQDTQPEYGGQMSTAYRERKCRSCKSSDLDYGSEKDLEPNGKDEAQHTGASMSKNSIMIAVSGPPGIGKSAVSQLIAQTLQNHGFETTMVGTVSVRSPEKLTTALQSVAKVARVTIGELRQQPILEATTKVIGADSGEGDDNG